MSELLDFDALWDYNQPDSTGQKFCQILANRKDADADYRLQLLTQIARTQGLQRQFVEAHQTLDQVEAQLNDSLPVARIRYLLERGRVFNSSKQPDQARPLFNQAFDLAQRARADFYAVDAAHMLAIVTAPTEQLEWNLKALAMAETSDSPRAQNWLGSLYNNIGWTYHDAQQYDEALTTFEKALAWQQSRGKTQETHIARWCIARTLRSLARLDDAIAILRDLEPSGDGYVYEELGECLLLRGKQMDAQPYFAQAYAVLSQDAWLIANESERLKRLAVLATPDDQESV
jgi:tetratricopeptide (TPR) repeat protein